MKILITYLKEIHYSEVAKIYQQGIDGGNSTFETKVPLFETWDKNHLNHSRLVAFEKDQLVGWAALSPVSERCVYEGVAEVSIYIENEFQQKGIGKLLLAELIIESEKNGIWSLQAGIFPENKPSIQLHLANGFSVLGERERIGKLNGIWKNTLLLYRRSKQTGI